MPDEELDELFIKIDSDGSGFIDYSEFIVACMDQDVLLSNEKLKSAFNMFDKDRDGCISNDEIKQIFQLGDKVDDSVMNAIIQ